MIQSQMQKDGEFLLSSSPICFTILQKHFCNRLRGVELPDQFFRIQNILSGRFLSATATIEGKIYFQYFTFCNTVIKNFFLSLFFFRLKDPPNPETELLDTEKMTDFSLYSWRVIDNPDIYEHITKDSLLMPYEICDDCINGNV